jgi:hypothetical protein
MLPDFRYLTMKQLPTTDSSPSNTTYFTGLPTTAPPSFHSVALSATNPGSTLPHRNDENAATIMPRRYRNAAPQQIVDMDEGISLWAPSESNDTQRERELEEARENTIAGLIGRVEELERRWESQSVCAFFVFFRLMHLPISMESLFNLK